MRSAINANEKMNDNTTRKSSARITLVAGGARGGKSRYALSKAEERGKALIFVATAQALDSGMSRRIQHHQSERGERWQLIEEPLDLAAILNDAQADQCLLIDCLTLWLSNWLCLDPDVESVPPGWIEQKTAFLSALETTSAEVILVTNEVGMGIVPMGQLSRNFVDESGWLHQDIARIADEVALVMFGIPQVLKS